MPGDRIEATRSGSLASRDKDRMAHAGKNAIALMRYSLSENAANVEPAALKVESPLKKLKPN